MRNASTAPAVRGLVAVTAAVLVLGSCVSREGPRAAPPPSEQSSEQSSDPPSDPPSDGECTVEEIEVTGGSGQRPVVTLPDTCSPPSELLIHDLVAGTDPVATTGSTIQVNYHLVTWSDGAEVDSSWQSAPPQPIEVADLGNQNNIIAGWNQGLLGVGQSGRRLLVIPPELAYPDGSGVIQPGETLVFVVDVLTVTGP
jgi:peptidylprolyl isomerase